MTTFIPVPTINLIASAASYFSNKGALSKETAIEVSTVDWTAMGFTALDSRTRYTFIKEEPNGKFWLDEKELENYNQKAKNKLFWLVFISALLMLGILSIPFWIS